MRASSQIKSPVAKQNLELGSNFFSSGLRQKVDQLMDMLYSGGVNNPMDSIEQISYLLFLRLLSEKDEQFAQLDKKYKRIFSGQWSKYAWGNFVTLTGDNLFNAVRDAIESLHELPGLSDTGKLLFSRATLKIYDRPTLRAVIQGIHGFDLAAHDGHDVKGDMYEYLLSKIAASGTNGQFRTPRHIIDLIVALVDPRPGQRICDPACGTAGFLISAFTHILRRHTKPADLKRGLVDGAMLKPAQWKFLEEQAFTGFENDANMVKIAILNLYLHQLERAQVEMRNPLTTGFGGVYPGQRFDCVLANPPFAGKVQDESILSDLNYKLNTRATELLFLKWFIDHLTPNGRAGVIVPQGVLSDRTKAGKYLRSMLLNDCALDAIITLPASCFRPYADAETAILIFHKGEKTKYVWFYELSHDGFTLDDRRTPIPENDIPNIIARWQKREDSPNSFSVSIHEIEKRGQVLSLGEFKKDHLTIRQGDLPAGWKVMRLDSLIEELNARAGSDHRYPVLSVTKHDGFVQSSTYFKKRVFSKDTSDYKVVERGQFAYSTIHLDEGAIGYLDKYVVGIISPMYKVFRLKVSEEVVHPAFLFRVLKSAAFMEKYRTLGKGSIKRRKSVAFEKFAAVPVPIPPEPIQRKVVDHIRAVQDLEARLETARGYLATEIERTLKLVGLA